MTSSSLVNTIGKILWVDGATPITPTSQEIYDAAAVMPPDIAALLVGYDDVANTPSDASDDVPVRTQVNLRLAPASLEERAVLVQDLRDDLQSRIDALDIPATSVLLDGLPKGQPAVRAVPAGLATVGIGLLENLSSNRAALTYLALALAGLFLILRTRSLGRTILALVPVFLAIGVSALVVWALDITLSPLTTVSGPLVVASVAEFSVLIMGRHIEERQKGLDPRPAVDTAARRTGRAFFTSALTIIGGFAVLISSSLPLLRDFGIIVTLNVTIALLAALVLMPPMLVWADERGLLHVADQIGTGKSLRLAANMPGPATPLAAIGTLAFAGATVGAYASADTSKGAEPIEIGYVGVATTTTTTTTTTSTTTTLAPGATVPPTTAPAPPKIDPTQFPAEVPPGGISGTLYDLLTAQGIDGSSAHCAIVTAYQYAGDEQALTALGLLQDPPAQPALDIVFQATRDCGIADDPVHAAIQAQFPSYVPPPPTTVAAAAPTATTTPPPKIDPTQFPAEVPPGGISDTLYGLLTDQGIDGSSAHCAIVTAYSYAGDEQTLIGLGLLQDPPDPAALEVVFRATRDCGIADPPVQAAIKVQFPNYQP